MKYTDKNVLLIEPDTIVGLHPDDYFNIDISYDLREKPFTSWNFPRFKEFVQGPARCEIRYSTNKSPPLFFRTRFIAIVNGAIIYGWCSIYNVEFASFNPERYAVVARSDGPLYYIGANLLSDEANVGDIARVAQQIANGSPKLLEG